MIDNTWVTDLQTTIYSRVKNIASEKLKSQFPKINFTTVPIDVGNTIFPTVYMHELEPIVLDDGLEQQATNKINYTMQIDVFANDKNKTDCKKISTVLMNIMNTMSFKGIFYVEYLNDYTHSVARYSREIHADDIF